MALKKINPQIDWSKYYQKNKHIQTPAQLLALKITHQLNDQAHKALYLRLCKYVHHGLIEQALSFVSDAQVDNKGKLFLWKVKQLRQEWLKQSKNPQNPQLRLAKKSQKKEKIVDLFTLLKDEK